jgi:hypothetical protein
MSVPFGADKERTRAIVLEGFQRHIDDLLRPIYDGTCFIDCNQPERIDCDTSPDEFAQPVCRRRCQATDVVLERRRYIAENTPPLARSHRHP